MRLREIVVLQQFHGCRLTELGEHLIRQQIGIQPVLHLGGRTIKLLRNFTDDMCAPVVLVIHRKRVRGARVHEELTPDFLRFYRAAGLEEASVCQQFNETAQRFIISARPDVIIKGLVQLRAPAPLMPAHQSDQLFSNTQVNSVGRVHETRAGARPSLPALSQLTCQHRDYPSRPDRSDPFGTAARRCAAR